MGNHTGTITPNQTITISKIYTYPCVGTGGHTEYARICNKTWNGTEARWNGYQEDWKNISFDESFVLYAGETYNYTIRTGSYPLIHHTAALPTASGWINCTEFVDANGKRYNDWIPAIRLIHEEETLRIGAFNIQIFGKSKASKPDVMEVLGKIIRTYDVVAIQEIRDKSQTALPALLEIVNSDDSQYDYNVSARLGRTNSSYKEQYAYIYNNQTVELTGTPHTYPEPAGTDPFRREPYIASFKALNGNFDFTLITIHTPPKNATEEINALDDVVTYAQSTYPDEQDFIVLGDLNADCSYFDEDSASTMHRSEYYWCINNSVDTTTKSTNCTYDRIIITNSTVADFSGEVGVFRYDIVYGLTEAETIAVSDHYPVYAEFWSNRDTDCATMPIATLTTKRKLCRKYTA